MSEAPPTPGNRRRIPRRPFRGPVAILSAGRLAVGRAHEMGEGGMLVSSPEPLAAGTQVVVNFYIGGTLVIVRANVRSSPAPSGGAEKTYGIEFRDLSFLFRREIRNFVASREALGES